MLAEGPQPGDTPTEIVDGFLAAGAAGFTDNFGTAREYLAGEAKATWDPSAGVARLGTRRARADDDRDRGHDRRPRRRPRRRGGRVRRGARRTGRESVTFGMVRNDADEWRIAATPPGLILQQEDFARLYRPASLYFLSPDQKFLVPEERWFPTKNLSTSIVRRAARRAVALAAGRGRDGRARRRRAQPRGRARRRDGVAAVRLEPALAVTRADRDLLIAQIDASLRARARHQLGAGVRPGRAARGVGDPGERLRSAGQRRVPPGGPPRRARRRRDRAGARAGPARRARRAQPGPQRGRLGAGHAVRRPAR